MKDRISQRRDHLGQYDDVRFVIGGTVYYAKVHGDDIWDVYREVAVKRGAFTYAETAPIASPALMMKMRELLEADQLAAMNDDA